ncbi:MAG: DUF3015 family protein [Polyangiaceae bacterium]
MRKAIWIAAVGITLVSSQALADGAAAPAAAAAPAPAAKSGGKKYGAAGCGLGSMIITSGGIVQIFAATTNNTGTQTFGITSGTSNCDDSDASSASTRVFVEANRVALAKDISRGAGETVAGLAAIAGCADAKAVGAALQHNFGVIFPSASTSDEAVTDAILTTLQSDASLSCSALGS